MVVTDRNGAKSPTVSIQVAFVGANSHAPILRVSRKWETVPVSNAYLSYHVLNRASGAFHGKCRRSGEYN